MQTSHSHKSFKNLSGLFMSVQVLIDFSEKRRFQKPVSQEGGQAGGVAFFKFRVLSNPTRQI
jgi:hypothetical protein